MDVPQRVVYRLDGISVEENVTPLTKGFRNAVISLRGIDRFYSVYITRSSFFMQCAVCIVDLHVIIDFLIDHWKGLCNPMAMLMVNSTHTELFFS